ncbi:MULTISPECIES: type II toxin-antitoxin system VapB family antitoxin [Sphingomonas]|uniref:type II toxin-antitoxin system VapB family antitoxin n=1 Tax=Sphingomonas TaxID=13687 RepID=UPI00193B7C50|nr:MULTISPECIES: type II toxin-antitoxin system VapB family antitoxin [Sphingomonas]
MRTNIDIDEKLVADITAVLGMNNQREAVEQALRDTLRVKRQLAALDGLRGLGWEGDLDEMRTSRYLPEQ